jgi:hypothetical protein
MALHRGLLAFSVLSTLAAPAFAASTAFRLTDLDLRDPHMYMSILGCRDLTDTPLAGFSFNADVQTRIQTDGDSDGLLDLSFLIVFDPLDQGGSGGPIRFGRSSCTAPMTTTTCGPSPSENLVALTSTNSAAGTCLGPIPGTTRPYTPAIASSSAPCFASADADLVIDLGNGVIFPLQSASVAARYVGSPATSLVSGLIRGFLSHAVADTIILPPSYPTVGGHPISILFPGGDPPGPDVNCAPHSDLDSPGGVSGWWMYFNFAATAVPYSGPQVSVQDLAGPRLWLRSANPSRLPLDLEYGIPVGGLARVAIHDVSGRLVSQLASGWATPGSHRLSWDGRVGDGRAAAGVYLARLVTAAGAASRKFVLLE